MILGVQLTIYTLYAVLSLISLFGVATLCFGLRIEGNIGVFLLGWLLVLLSLFSIGMMVGGIAKDIKVAGVIASLLYFPMLICSGATLPYEVMPVAMQRVADLVPLTQGIKVLKAATLGLPMEQVGLPIVILLGISGVCSVIAIRCFKWE